MPLSLASSTFHLKSNSKLYMNSSRLVSFPLREEKQIVFPGVLSYLTPFSRATLRVPSFPAVATHCFSGERKDAEAARRGEFCVGCLKDLVPVQLN